MQITVDTGPDIFMNAAMETDQRVVNEESQFGVGRKTLPRMQRDEIGAMISLFQLVAQGGSGFWEDALIRIDIENPPTLCLVEGMVPSGGEVVSPDEFEQPSTMLEGNSAGVVRGTGIDDHNLIYDITDGCQAVAEESLLVFDDQRG